MSDKNSPNQRASDDFLREKVRSAIKAAGGNQVVAAKSGVPISTIGGFLGGKTEIRASALAAIAYTCGVSLDSLFYQHSVAIDQQLPVQDKNYIPISRFPISASAGRGQKIFADPPASFWQVPREMLRGFSGNAKHLASINISGDSMEPTLHDGEPIIFDQSSKTVDREGVYVLTIGDELFVKRVRRVPQSDGSISLDLISDNPAYDKLTIGSDTEEHITVHGRVIWPSTSRRL